MLQRFTPAAASDQKTPSPATMNASATVARTSRPIMSSAAAMVAWAEGVGSNWTGFGGLDGVRKKVGLPDTDEVLAVVPFGYPRRNIGKGKKKRKSLAEVASAERFGTPLT